jgi:hypothetical protein
MNIAIGRRRELSFRRRLDVVLTWDERYHALVRREAAGKLAGRLRALSRRMVRLRASGASIIEVARLSAEMDRLGRSYAVQFYKPDTPKPQIDRQVAKLFGTTARMVRRIRDDPSLSPFRATPPWEVPDWQVAAHRESVARKLARKLMTAERLAKGELVRIFNGALQVPLRVGLEWEIVLGPAPLGARCSFISTLPRMPTDREARAQRAIKAFKARASAWKKSLE